MRILILKDRLSARAGTTKMAAELARGFSFLGNQAYLRFLSRSDDAALVEGTLRDVRFTVGKHGLLGSLTDMLAAPLLKTVLKGSFVRGDVPNLIGGLVDRFSQDQIRSADLVIFMNMWSAAPALLVPKPSHQRWVLFMHETPSFRDIPPGIRGVIGAYLQRVRTSVDLVVAVTERLAQDLSSQWVERIMGLDHGVPKATLSLPKTNSVLADSRWTTERDPWFLLELMELLPGVPFVMCGQFGDPEVLARFRLEIEHRGLSERLSLRPGLSEGELQATYAMAKYYVRWSATHGELGPSFGALQAIGNLCVPVIDEGLGFAPKLASAIGPELVVRRSPRAFADALQLLMCNDDFYRRMQQRVDDYRKAHGWEEYCERLLRGLPKALTET